MGVTSCLTRPLCCDAGVESHCVGNHERLLRLLHMVVRTSGDTAAAETAGDLAPPCKALTGRMGGLPSPKHIFVRRETGAAVDVGVVRQHCGGLKVGPKVGLGWPAS